MPASLRLSVRPLGRFDPEVLFRDVAEQRMPFFLDSSLRDTELARYSFLGANPLGWFRSRGDRAAFASPWGEESRRGDPLTSFRVFLDGLPQASLGRPPYPFVGGVVGTFAYDLGRSLERLPDEKPPDLGVPDIHVGVYPHVTLVDHVWGEAFAVSPRDEIRYDLPPIPDDLLVPRNPRPVEPLDREAYVRSIERAKAYIADGEIFQANLSHRVALPLPGGPARAYERLRARTPATFGAYVDAWDHHVLSASPERFLRARGRDVETRPIKGTRPRGSTPDDDRRLAAALLASDKDAAENVMIVDLERNDLGKVCTFGSVHVPRLRALRTLPTVHHLESVVRGRLRADVDVVDLLRATFPGGSVTGAPKPRAMEIIERLEPHRRGVYTGAIGYVSWDRSIDLNLAIRTATVVGRTAYFAVGGGIVADSDPRAEYQETLDKLRGHAEALVDRPEVTVHGIRLA
jgi:para-aminobenzoate synthetase component 1